MDTMEKNHQVGSMAQIYPRCERVIIWLNSSSVSVRKLMDQYHKLPTLEQRTQKKVEAQLVYMLLDNNVYFTRS